MGTLFTPNLISNNGQKLKGNTRKGSTQKLNDITTRVNVQNHAPNNLFEYNLILSKEVG